MKKIVSLLLVLLLLTTTVFAETYSNKLDILSAMDAVSKANNPTYLVTRAEFAQAAAILSGSGEIAPMDTDFADVKKDNKYSGYIKYLADNGIIEVTENFDPEGCCSRQFSLTTALNAVGYGEYINMMGGMESAAAKLKLSQKAVFENGNLTYEGLTHLMYSMLFVPLPSITYTTAGNEYLETVKTFSNKVHLVERLGLSVLNGVVTEVDFKGYRVGVDIDEIIYTDSGRIFNKGKGYTLNASLGIDINKYEMVPVTFWVDENDKVIAMYPQEDYSVVYAPIYSVNGDSSATAPYAISDINRLMLLDDKKEYDVAPDAKARHNLENTTKPQKYAGSYAKLIMHNDDVVYIETWDLTEGGIISEIGDTNVSYKKGTASYKINPITQFDRKIVIINDESRDYADLKTDTYFDFYKVNNDTLVVVANEKIITSTFNGLGSDFISIGDVSYITAKNMYFCSDGEKYVAVNTASPAYDESNLLSAAGLEVNVFFNAKREACYISLAPGNELVLKEFLGLISGYSEKKFNEKAKMAVIPLEGDDFTKKVYEVSDKCTYLDGLNLETVLGNANKINGDGIYLFTLNGKDEIRKVEKPSGIKGFEDENGYTGKSEGSSKTNIIYTVPGANYISCLIDGRRYYYDVNTDIRVLYVNSDGEPAVTTIKPKQTTGNSIAGIDGTTSAYLRLFGYENSMDLRLAVMVNAKSIYKWDEVYGFIEKSGISLGENEEVLVNVILTDKEGSKTYAISKEAADTLPDHAYGAWYPDAKISKDPIKFGNNGVIANLTYDFEAWGKPNNDSVHTGYVEEAFTNGFIISEGGEKAVGYAVASDVKVMKVGERGKNGIYKMEEMQIDNIVPGDTITYILAPEPRLGVICAIFVKE